MFKCISGKEVSRQVLTGKGWGEVLKSPNKIKTEN